MHGVVFFARDDERVASFFLINIFYQCCLGFDCFCLRSSKGKEEGMRESLERDLRKRVDA